LATGHKVVDVFVIPSGAHLDRPDLARMLLDAEAGKLSTMRQGRTKTPLRSDAVTKIAHTVARRIATGNRNRMTGWDFRRNSR